MILTGNINEVTRKVTFEQASAVVAVVGDYDVNGVAFGFPASYEDDFDLSTGVKTVFYEATDGTVYNHVITDTDTDTGLPLWVFTDEINKGAAGTVKFAIVIDDVEGGTIVKRWVSLITKFEVKKSIEIDTSEQEQNEQTYSERLAYLMTQVAAMQTVINGISSGTPTAVSTVAGMTNTSLLYLYTGSESGYTAGNWYYYNGSAWTSGGAYGNSAEVIAARTNAVDGTTYQDLQTRLDTENSALKGDLNDLELRVEDIEQGGTGGLSMTAVNLLNAILSEAVYGTDQTANIALLYNELSNVAPVSISAVLNGIALEGQSYSELSFTVTATFDDESTQMVANYTIVTTGTVAAGSNTVTIRYRGLTTTCTFTAEAVTTYTITNNLTNVTSSNATTVVVENSYYSATLTADTDYAFASCTVTMGGVDVTSTVYSNQEILITEVTGDVVITASATQITYLDDLLPTRDRGYTYVNGYPNGSVEDTPVISAAYTYAPFVSEYPALNDCTIHWRIKNISDSDVSLNSCGFGNINPDDVYGFSSANVKAFYCVKADNSSHKLAPGAELEGDVTIKGGMQLCFICNYDDFSKFEIKLRGNYTPDTFDGYAEINPTYANTSAYGAYRSVTYYKDNGSEALATRNDAPRKLAENLEAGTYDMYCSTINAGSISVLVGGMSENTDTSVYYAGGSDNALNRALWHHSTFTLSSSTMVFVSSPLPTNLDNTNAKLRIMYKKVVSI